jgi:seryl-tRNA synthetase
LKGHRVEANIALMLDLNFVADHLDLVSSRLRDRGLELDLSEVASLNAERKRLQTEISQMRHEHQKESQQIGALMKEKKQKEATELRGRLREASNDIKAKEERQGEVEELLRQLVIALPNLPDESVPVGRDSSANVELRRHGEPPSFDFTPRPHWEVGAELGILDFDRAAKLSGARFVVYLDLGAKLERALINFMLDLQTTKRGYREVMPPILVNATTLEGTGQLPKFEDDLFKVRERDLYLIPTAEVPLTNLHRDEVLESDQLPLYYAAYTPCFRSEAGSYGKDVRGLIRQHQFNKVELVKFTTPETSFQELEKMTADAEEVLKQLELPYRVVTLCTGDMGFAAAKTYDLEVWLPAQDGYREISSCSNCTDFQARRAKIRYRPDAKSKVRFVHTLNGSGLAVGRTLVAILENFQNRDGSVQVPKVLRPYLGGVDRLTSRTSS